MGTFTMPSLGADMEAGTLVEWLKHPGDELIRGDIIAVVETEKGAIEVEIFEDGRLDRLLVETGETVPVGTPLAEIVGAGEAPAAPAEVPAPTALEPPRPAPVALQTVPPAAAGLRVSPAARRLAEERNVDLAAISGTGPEGAIVQEDVMAALAKVRPAKGPDLGPMRRAIAAAMTRSKREIPHYYLSHSLDVSVAQQWLAAYNAERQPGERLVFGVLLLKATAVALRDFPEFNGSYGADGFVHSKAIHLGAAIAIRGGGLAAPAIHDTDALQLAELMAKLRDLVSRVRHGGFRSSEISDPTATVSSLGERGVEALLPIIYPPQVAIVGFGATLPRPWAIGEGVAVRPVVTATLAADHRVSDGHRGALLLRQIGELLERPEAL